MPRLFFTAALVLLTAVPSLAQGAAADTPSVLTLENAIAEAQRNNREIKIVNQNVLYANDEILAAHTQRYADFNVQISGSHLLTAVHVPEGVFGKVGTTPIPNTNSVITTSPSASALTLIQVQQPLSKLYDVHLNVQLLKVGKQLSQEELRRERQEITNSVKSAYYSLLQLQSAGVKVQLARAELQVTTFEDTIETQTENLNNLMGRDIREDFRLSGVPDAIPEERRFIADLCGRRCATRKLAGRTSLRSSRCCWCRCSIPIFVLDLKIVKGGAVERDEPGDLPLQPKGELS